MKVYKSIKQEYVSFDVFDTLLYRDVKHPREIFEIVEQKLYQKNKSKFIGFSKRRIEAEKVAPKLLNKREPNLEEIYSLIEFASKKDRKMALEIELATEKEHLYPNLLLKKRLEILKSEGKKIILISDMYMDEQDLRNILLENGISFDYLFVSSKVQKRKSRGELYSHVLKELHISRKNLIHIGDNFKSDYVIPKLMGIKSIKYARKKDTHILKLNQVNTKDAHTLIDMIQRKKCLDYYEAIGYTMLGPALLGFCEWIHNFVKEKKLDELYFLSRDGQIIQKVYYQLYKEEHSYFYASRRALTVPLLVNAKNMRDVLEIVSYIKREETIADFLQKVGVDDSNILSSLQEKYGTMISREDLLNQKGQEIYDIISKPMHENAKSELYAATQYMTQNIENHHVGLVDIGWYGTMQNALEKISTSKNTKYDFYGLYFGLLDNKRYHLQAASGFIYDFHMPKRFQSSKIYGFNGLLELMFTADHPSVKKYIEKNQKSMFILTEDKGEYSDFVQKVQQGCMEFIDDIVNSSIEIHVDDTLSYLMLEDLLTHPTVEECYLLENIMFYDSYYERLIQFDGWKDLLLHPKRCFSKFLKSNWKIGFIKEALPFCNPDTLYGILNKLKH